MVKCYIYEIVSLKLVIFGEDFVLRQSRKKSVALTKIKLNWSIRNGVEKMRVMLLASGDLWAGAEVMVYQLSCGLKKIDNVKILVVLLNNGRLAEKLKSAGVEVQIVDEAQLSILYLAQEIHKIIKEFSPHIIHSHRYKENIVAWLMTSFMQKVRLVATQHGMPETVCEKQGFKDRLRSVFSFYLLSFGFQKIVVVSQDIQNLLLKRYSFSEKKFEVIHNGVSLPLEVVKPRSGILRVGSAGRLFPVKGYDFFVEVAAKVISISKQFQFVVAGDGPEHKRLKTDIVKHGLQDHFTLFGHVDNMDDFYKSLDVYVNTSVHEGIPMSVLEAMGYGLPVVVPHVGGFPEIVEDGESGYLVAERSIDLFALKILSLVDLKQKKKMANSARKRVERSFSRKAMVEKYYQLYVNVLSGE